MTKQEQIELASILLNISIERVVECSGTIQENGALYVSIPEKGGDSIIIALDGTVLYANSSVGFEQHLAEFNRGRRTDIKDFNN